MSTEDVFWPLDVLDPSGPGVGCKRGPDCRERPRYQCSWCRRLRPWCFGGADNRPTWCDDCWWLFASLDATPPTPSTERP